MKSLRWLWLILALPLAAFAAESTPVKKGAVEVQLVSDASAIEPGKPFTIALRMKHDAHWHSYWIAPGTGYPTSLTWKLPEGFKAGEIQWPTPHVVKDSSGKITGNGYEGENFLLVEITPPLSGFRADENPGQTPGSQQVATVPFAPGGSVQLKATAEWLMCEAVCMPGDAKLEINFPTAAKGGGQPDSKWTSAISATRERLPKSNPAWTVTATRTDKTATLRVQPNSGTSHQPTDLHFFSSDGYTDYAKPETVTQEKGGWIIQMDLDAAAEKNTARLVGVLVSGNGWKPSSGYEGILIDAPFSENQVAVSMLQPPSVATQAGSGLLGTIALAFIGGLILNLMPCVFPVLGIKILGFVNQSGSDQAKVVKHGLVFTLGVLISFWTLSGALLALRAGGAQLGWGAQLQSPAFVFGMASFLLIFALNLSGLFEIGLSATGVGANLQMKDGYLGSFFTGALAVLVATPCSAPFLAPALGAAFSSSFSAAQSMAIFTAIGLGLSTPYLLLSIFPQAIKSLPKPGAWMETFKQLMAFPLYATVGWLLWVLAGQTKDDDNALLLITFGFVFVAMAAWLYGRFGQAWGKPGKQLFGRVAAALLLAAGLYTGWPKEAAATEVRSGEYQVTWEKWSPEAVAAAQAAGKFVYVDFTARWCATCQTNKATVFHSDDVLAELKKKNVVLLRGDWTNRDPKITAELARWSRSAVPFNLIYAPGKAAPVQLPELLTPGKVLDAFNAAAAN